MTFTTILFTVIVIAVSLAKVGKAVEKSVHVPATDGNDIPSPEEMSDQDGEIGKSVDFEYFSYENEPGNSFYSAPKAPNTKSASSADDVTIGSEVVQSLPQFDLRQAVLYNAILNNDYIEYRH